MAAPTFLSIGPIRSGTSTLWEYFRRHPQVHVPSEKEVHFFDRHYDLGIDRYENLFDEGFSVRGELTPSYLFHLDRIKKHYPDIKLILHIRDPIERYVSEVSHNIRMLVENYAERYENAEDKAHLQGGLNRLVMKSRLSSPEFVHHIQDLANIKGMLVRPDATELKWARYDQTIEKLKALDFDFYLLSCETMATGYQKAYDGVCDFIGAPRFETAPIRRNASDRITFQLTDTERQALRVYYEPVYTYLREEHGITFDG